MIRAQRLALLALALAIAAPATAQQAIAPSLSLAEALVELARRCEVSLIYDPGLVFGRVAITQLNGDDPEELLRDLLLDTGLIPIRLSSGTFAILREETEVVATGMGQVSGRVLDAASGRPVPDVHISLPDYPQLVTASVSDGTFRLTRVPTGLHRLRTSHVSYLPRSDTISVRAESETRLLLHLYSETVYLDVVEVEDSIASPGSRSMTIRPERGDRLSTSAGTRDAILTLEGFAGVQAERGSSNLHVQGGDAGDHQLVLDGMPVFEPVHLRGLIGVFSPYALRSVTVHRAGFGAPLGSRISGVIVAEHALESSEGHRLNAHIDPLSLNTRMTVGGQLTRSLRGHLMLALRTNHGLAQEQVSRQLRQWNESDPFLQYATLLSLIEDDPAAGTAYAALLRPPVDTLRASARIGFTDVHAAGRLEFSGGGVLYTSLYRSSNAMEGSRLLVRADEPERAPQAADAFDWRNVNGQISYSQPMGGRTVVRTQMRRSRYVLGHSYVAPDNRNTFWILTPDLELRELRLETRPADDGNHITEIAADGRAYLALGQGATLQAGLEATRTSHRFRVDDLFFRPINSEGDSWRYSAYAEQELTDKRRTARAGLRVTAAPGRSDLYVEPRASVETRGPFGAPDEFTLRLAGGIYRQFLNQYDLSSVSPSSLAPSIRFWLPTDSTITPPKAYHASACLEVKTASNWTLMVDGFYRNQPHLLNIDYASLWERLREEKPAAALQSEFLESGRGHAVGVAATALYNTARLQGRVRSELSRSRRTFAFLGEDPEVAPWSEPAALYAVLDWHFHRSFQFAARWKSTWGRSWAFRQAYYNYLGADPLTSHRFGEFDLRKPADHRLPNFYQLDIGVHYRGDAAGVDVRAGLDIVNVLGRSNVVDFAFAFSYTPDDGLQYTRTARVLSPRLFVASISAAW